MKNTFKRANLSTKLLFMALATTAFMFTLFTGCKKNDIKLSEPETNELKKETSFYVTNQPVTFFASDKDGNPLTSDGVKEKNSNRLSRLMSSTCDDWDPGFVNGSFKGHVSEVLYSQNPNDMVSVRFTYELLTPADPVTTSSNNKGRVRFSTGTWPTFSPLITITVPLTFEYIDSYYDAVLDATMKRYKVVYWISLKYSDFCSYQSYKTNLTVETNCYAIGTVTTSYQVDAQKLTPDAYQPYEYGANSSSSTINFFPLICLCTHQCHFPSYGSSQKHQVQYRLIGSNNWTTVTYTDLSSHNVTVSSGNYEFRSRGVVTTNPDIYSDYTTIQTITVP